MALTTTFSPNFYNKVPDLSEAVPIFNATKATDAIDQLGKIFVKHSACEKFALIINHRHFELGPNEILVESVREDHSLSVAIPWNVIDNVASPVDVKYWNSFEFEKKRFVVPRTWAFVSGNETAGAIEPIEFVATDDAEPDPDAGFIADLHAELKSLGLEYVFGLRRMRRITNISGYETTPAGVRANITKFADSVPPELDRNLLIKVVFHIDEHGRSGTGDMCMDHCTTHCGGCYCYIVDWH